MLISNISIDIWFSLFFYIFTNKYFKIRFRFELFRYTRRYDNYDNSGLYVYEYKICYNVNWEMIKKKKKKGNENENF